MLVLPRRMAGAIEIFDNAFQAQDCEKILQIIVSDGDWNRASVGKDSDIDEIRTNDAKYVHLNSFKNDSAIWEFGKVLYDYLDDYGTRYDVGFSGIEAACINRYDVGQRYKAHADDGPGCPRVISALIYMNDVEEGGETHFPLFDVTVQPKKGRLVIFPSNYAYLHEARPPTSGVKYSMAVWTTPIR